MLCPGVTAICADGPNSFFFFRVVGERTEKKIQNVTSKINTQFRGPTACTVHTRQYTQVAYLPIHTNPVTLSILIERKDTWSTCFRGIRQVVALNTFHPDTPWLAHI